MDIQESSESIIRIVVSVEAPLEELAANGPDEFIALARAELEKKLAPLSVWAKNSKSAVAETPTKR